SIHSGACRRARCSTGEDSHVAASCSGIREGRYRHTQAAISSYIDHPGVAVEVLQNNVAIMDIDVNSRLGGAGGSVVQEQRARSRNQGRAAVVGIDVARDIQRASGNELE